MEYANISHKYHYFCGGDMHSKTTYFVVLDRSGNCVRRNNLSNCFATFNEFIKPCGYLGQDGNKNILFTQARKSDYHSICRCSCKCTMFHLIPKLVVFFIGSCTKSDI